MTSLRKMVEENNARHASQLRELKKPAENIPNKPNVTESALEIGSKQSTGPRSETSLQTGTDIADVNPSSSDLAESKIPTTLPSATAVLDVGSRVLGIGLSISALLSMHKQSLKLKQNMAKNLYRAPLVPDAAFVGLNSAAASLSQRSSNISNISNTSIVSHDSNRLRPSTATDPLALQGPESKTLAASGQGDSEDSNDQSHTSYTEDTGRNNDTSKASLKRKRLGPEDDSGIDTSPEPEPMHGRRRGGGGIPIKARLARTNYRMHSSEPPAFMDQTALQQERLQQIRLRQARRVLSGDQAPPPKTVSQEISQSHGLS